MIIAYPSMKFFFEPAKRHRKDSTSATVQSTVGTIAINRILPRREIARLRDMHKIGWMDFTLCKSFVGEVLQVIGEVTQRM